MNYNLYKLEFHFFTFTWHPIYYTVLYVLVDDTGHSRDNGAKHWFYWFIVLSCIGAESPSTFSTPSQSTPFPINPKWSKRPSKNDSINWHSISNTKMKIYSYTNMNCSKLLCKYTSRFIVHQTPKCNKGAKIIRLHTAGFTYLKIN